MSWCKDGELGAEFTMETRTPFIYNTKGTVYLKTGNSNMTVEITHAEPWVNDVMPFPHKRNGQVQGASSVIGIEGEIKKAFPGIENGPITYTGNVGWVNGQGADISTARWTQTVELDGIWLRYKLGMEAL